MNSSLIPFILKETVLCILSWLIYAIISVPLVPVVLILSIWKCCVNTIVKMLHSEWIPLDPLDIGCAIGLEYCTDKVLPNIGIALVCNGEVKVDDFRKEFQEKILDSSWEQDENGIIQPAQYDRLKKVPKRFLGYYYWSEPLERVDLEKAIYETREFDERPYTISEFVSKWIHEPYKNGSGLLWEICIRKFPQEHPGKTVILFKMMHCLGDGYAVERIFTKLGHVQPPFHPSSIKHRRSMSIGHQLLLLLIGPRLIFHYMISTICGSDYLSRKQKLGEAFISTAFFELCAVKRIRRRLQCRFNDIFLGLIGASCRKLLTASGQKCMPDFIPVVVPVALPRKFSDPMRNRMTTSIFQVPIAHSDTQDMIRQLSAESKSLYYTLALPHVLSYFIGLPGLLPACMLKPPSGNPRVYAGLTTLLPVENTLKIANCEVVTVSGLIGLQLKQTGIIVAVGVYKDITCVTLVGNKGIFPTQEAFDEFAAHSCEEFKKLEESVS